MRVLRLATGVGPWCVGRSLFRSAWIALGVVVAGLSFGPGALRAQEVCSTPALADMVIASAAAGSDLVMAVAGVVPSDPVHCVPSFCAASLDEDEDTRVAVGAGISEAYAAFKAQEEDEAARLVRVATCSAGCDRAVMSAFAASQASPVSYFCDPANTAGDVEVRAPWDVGGGGGGGTSGAVSGN